MWRFRNETDVPDVPGMSFSYDLCYVTEWAAKLLLARLAELLMNIHQGSLYPRFASRYL